MKRDVDHEAETPAGGDGNAPDRPFAPVALALFAAVLAVLVGGYLLATRLRPTVGIEPPPGAVPAAPTRAPVTHGPPTVATGSAPTQAPVPPTPTPAGLLPGIGVGNTPTEREVEAAHEKYLRIYSDAVLNLDTSRLDEVLAGEALVLVTEEVNDRKARGRPLKLIEDERLVALTDVTETSAILVEEYTSRSVIVDSGTGQLLPRSSPPSRVRQIYDLRKTAGVWRIVDWSRQELGEARR